METRRSLSNDLQNKTQQRVCVCACFCVFVCVTTRVCSASAVGRRTNEVGDKIMVLVLVLLVLVTTSEQSNAEKKGLL